MNHLEKEALQMAWNQIERLAADNATLSRLLAEAIAEIDQLHADKAELLEVDMVDMEDWLEADADECDCCSPSTHRAWRIFCQNWHEWSQSTGIQQCSAIELCKNLGTYLQHFLWHGCTDLPKILGRRLAGHPRAITKDYTYLIHKGKRIRGIQYWSVEQITNTGE